MGPKKEKLLDPCSSSGMVNEKYIKLNFSYRNCSYRGTVELLICEKNHGKPPTSLTSSTVEIEMQFYINHSGALLYVKLASGIIHKLR